MYTVARYLILAATIVAMSTVMWFVDGLAGNVWPRTAIVITIVVLGFLGNRAVTTLERRSKSAE